MTADVDVTNDLSKPLLDSVPSAQVFNERIERFNSQALQPLKELNGTKGIVYIRKWTVYSPSFLVFLFNRWLNAQRESRENWTPAQRIDRVRGGDRDKNPTPIPACFHVRD